MNDGFMAPLRYWSFSRCHPEGTFLVEHYLLTLNEWVIFVSHTMASLVIAVSSVENGSGGQRGHLRTPRRNLRRHIVLREPLGENKGFPLVTFPCSFMELLFSAAFLFGVALYSSLWSSLMARADVCP